MSSRRAIAAAAAAIDVRGVTKTFGTLKAVGGLDLAIPRGAIYDFKTLMKWLRAA